MGHPQFCEVTFELSLLPEPKHQLAYLSEETDGLLVGLVIFPLQHGLNLLLVDRQRISRMLFSPIRSEFQPKIVCATALLGMI